MGGRISTRCPRETNENENYRVLAGKRIVIQEVDSSAWLDPGLKLVSLQIETNPSVWHDFTATFMGTFALTGLGHDGCDYGDRIKCYQQRLIGMSRSFWHSGDIRTDP